LIATIARAKSLPDEAVAGPNQKESNDEGNKEDNDYF
jgi:hypothetical protein